MMNRNSPFHLFPSDLIGEIFSHLNIANLPKNCCVCKRWLKLKPTIWKSILYKRAFGIDKWAAALGQDCVKDENRGEELSALNWNIVNEYQKFQIAFPDKNVEDNLMLVWLPKTLNGGLTLKNLESLVKPFFSHILNYRCPFTAATLEQSSIDKSRFVLMTRKVLPESGQKCYEQQQQIVSDLAKFFLIDYKIPEVLEIVTCILAQYLSTNIQIFGKDESLTNFTRCKENIQGYQVVVGDFRSEGLTVSYYEDDTAWNLGVVALKSFSSLI